MARQNNAAYWAQRFKNMEDALQDQSFAYVENLDRQFAAAQTEVERQIAAWYQRFAANNEIDLAEAKRLLTSGELEEFHWTVEEYIKYGQQNALDGAWVKQLENASARVHISRLEALKLQIQQQAEALYGSQLDFVDAAARRMYEGSYYRTAFEVQRGLGVGWSMQAINESTIQKVLSRPWTTDNQTFRDRCWTNKEHLVNTVNTQLTQMIIRGEPPDRAITAITKQFGVARTKAGRLVMTESAYFASAAQKDCFSELGVERYKVVASFDKDTCELCGALDGKVFKMSEYQVGLTAPPFHPWCRCCTCPYFEDLEGVGERWYRNPDGTTGKVPADMSFDEWRDKYLQKGIASPTKSAKIDTIEKAVGVKQSTPLSIVDAVTGANPGFSTGTWGYTENCQRCVQSYELRRRGYDVIATERPKTGNTILWGSECFVDAAGQPTSGYKFLMSEADVKKELAAAPDGARYGVYVRWQGPQSSAHVFVAEKVNGSVQYVDPQSGKLDASGYFARGEAGNFGLFRMDDKQITTDPAILSATVEVKKP